MYWYLWPLGVGAVGIIITVYFFVKSFFLSEDSYINETYAIYSALITLAVVSGFLGGHYL